VPERRTVALGLAGVASRPLEGTSLTGGSLSLLVHAGPSWWLSAGYGRNDVLASPAAARLGFGAVTLAIGLPPLRLGSRVQLAVGLAAQGGFLSAEGVGVDVPLSVRRSYWGAGVVARLQWEAADRVFLFVQPSAIAPLVERRFSVREPYALVTKTAVVAPEVAAGLALGL
jgi:hypothetical protein